MKAALLLGCLLAFASNSFACSCAPANFSYDDVDQVLENFLSDKLRINSVDVKDTNFIKSRPYFTRGQRLVIGFGSRACERDCERHQNLDADYEVKFGRGNKNCVVGLRVIMTSNMVRKGFKSWVKQKMVPACR